MENTVKQKRKTIDEVFNDYEEKTKLVQCEIISIKMFKKTNQLELDLLSDEVLEIREIANFEKYLRLRFNIREVEIRIQYKMILPNINNSS